MYLKKLFTGILLLSTLLSGNVFSAEETPDYEPILKEGAYEIRDYPPILVAKATGGNLFRTIADYIFGNNSRNEEIPMTAPVFSQTKGDKMTMMFYMPSYFSSLQELPKPNNRRVKLGVFELGKVVVARFSGYNNYERQQQVLKKLVRWAKGKKLQFREDNYFSAGYDSPWVPANQRTNEVLIRIK